MIVLDSGDKIRGDASVAAVVDYTLHGLAGGNLAQLDDGQLADSVGDLYTAGATVVVTAILLTNTHSAALTVNLFLLPSGGTARRILAKDLTLGIGFSLHYDGAKVSVLAPSGGLVASYTNHASSHVDGNDDIQNATSGQKGLATATQITKLDGIEASADVTNAVNVASSIHGVAGKTTPVDADEVGLIDSAAANVLKKLTWTNIKATLKTYFDTLYQAVNTAVLKSLGTTKGDIVGFSGSATPVRLGVGSNDQVLTADSGETLGLKWVAGGGDVTAAANLGNNKLIRGDGGAKVIQESTIIVSDSGEMTNPSQPCFNVCPAANQEDIAIGIVVDVLFGAELFDQGNNFASSVFTAPITGKYQLNLVLRLDNVDTAVDYYHLRITTSNKVYPNSFVPLYTSDIPRLTFVVNIIADMDVNDTAKICILQVQGTSQTDININSCFSGALIC